MSLEPQSSLAFRFRAISGAAALIVALMGLVVLMGWALAIPTLKSVVPGLATMKANTALAFLLSGAALWLLREGRREQAGTLALNLARLLALAVVVIGLLSLFENLVSWDLGIDHLLIRDWSPATATSTPGRMAAATALNFFLVGLALLLLDTPWPAAADYPAAIAGSVSLIAVIGYAYGIKALYAVSPYATVALHTALGFVLLCAGILTALPRHGFTTLLVSNLPGGTLVRRLLLPAVAIPVVIGWLSVRGHSAGLYGTEFAAALFAMSNIVVFVVLVAFTAQSLNRGERERQRILQALAFTQERLAHVVSSSPAVLYAFKVEGTALLPTWVSENLERLLGYTPAEVTGREWWEERIHTQDLEWVAAQRPALFTEGHVAREYRFRHKDGTYRWLSDEQRLLKDAAGRPQEVVGSWSDVTPRKQAEERLHESEREYRLLFETNPQPMWVYDEETLIFLAVNKAAIDHYGYSRAEFMGMTIHHIRPLEEVSPLEEQLAQRRTENDAKTVYSPRVWKHRKKDGTLIDVEIVVSPIDFGGRRVWLTLARDITDKKRLEAQLVQSQKMESVGRLAGGVAHDFNNILGVITGYAELLDKHLPDEARLRKYVKDILKGAERAAGLTRQLLAFSRQQVLQPRNVDLNASVGEMEKMLRRLIGEDIQLITIL